MGVGGGFRVGGGFKPTAEWAFAAPGAFDAAAGIKKKGGEVRPPRWHRQRAPKKRKNKSALVEHEKNMKKY